MVERKQIAVLLHLLDEAYDAPAWHGPNLRGALQGMTPSAAAWRPGRRNHSVWEIALHAAYWKYAVRRRITGEKRGSFPLAGSNWFVRPDMEGMGRWRKDLELLDREHGLLRAAVASLTDSALRKRSGRAGMTHLRLIAGIAAHDIYHAGQIRLVKRLSARRH